MPIIQIKALPQNRQIDTSTVLKKLCSKIATDLGLPKHHVWATWETLLPGNYVEGDKEALSQERSTHPPLVTLLAFEGHSQKTIATMMESIATILAAELHVEPGNVFITYTEATSGHVYTGGEIQYREQPRQFARTFSKAPWETQIGYCRALRAGDHMYFTGTAPIDDKGEVYAPGDGYAQAKRCLEIIEHALKNLEADRRCVVRTRMFVTDITRWAEFGRAHREFFEEYPPATTMVEVKSLIHPAMLIEIEADAVQGTR